MRAARTRSTNEIETAEICGMIAHTTQAGLGMPCGDDIELRIARSARGQIYDLEVENDGRQLVLRGRCRTYYVKQLAQQAALELAAPATRVVNHISIM